MRLTCLTWNLGAAPPEFAGALDAVMVDAAASVLASRPLPDVLAFQEVWFPRNLRTLAAELSEEYVEVPAPEVATKPGTPWWTWPLLVTLPLAVVWSLRQGGLATFVRRGEWSVRASAFRQYAQEASAARVWEGDGYGDKGVHEALLVHAASGVEIAVLNTHVQAEYRGDPERHRAVRSAQLEELTRSARERRSLDAVVALGDLNTRPSERGVLPAAGWRDLTERDRDAAARTTVADGASGGWLDYVLAMNGRSTIVPGGWGLLEEVRRDGRQPPISDHYGVRASFELQRAERALGAPLALAAWCAPSTRRRWLAASALLALEATLGGIAG